MRWLFLSLITLAFGPGMAQAQTVNIFAAASLKGPLDQALADWPGAVRVSYGASSVLARQIKAGAPADVFLSASPVWMDVLEQAGLIAPASRRNLWSNEVVIAAGTGAAPIELQDLPEALGTGRLATALTASVPLGQYAQHAFQRAGLWEEVAEHLVQTDTARTALVLLQTGQVDYGALYASDVQATGLAVVARFPQSAQPEILYPGAVLIGRPGEEILAHLAGSEVFGTAGFLPVPVP